MTKKTKFKSNQLELSSHKGIISVFSFYSKKSINYSLIQKEVGSLEIKQSGQSYRTVISISNKKKEKKEKCIQCGQQR